jgi:hypothetical protein
MTCHHDGSQGSAATDVELAFHHAIANRRGCDPEVRDGMPS